jgi:hypothetical protein
MKEKLVNSVVCIAVSHATVHNTTCVQCCAEFGAVLLSAVGGDICWEACDVYIMAGRNESSLDTSSFFLTRRIQIFLPNLVWTLCLIMNLRKITLFLNVTPCSPVDSYQHFEICCLHLQGRSPRRNWINSSAIMNTWLFSMYEYIWSLGDWISYLN